MNFLSVSNQLFPFVLYVDSLYPDVFVTVGSSLQFAKWIFCMVMGIWKEKKFWLIQWVQTNLTNTDEKRKNFQQKWYTAKCNKKKENFSFWRFNKIAPVHFLYWFWSSWKDFRNVYLNYTANLNWILSETIYNITTNQFSFSIPTGKKKKKNRPLNITHYNILQFQQSPKITSYWGKFA